MLVLKNCFCVYDGEQRIFNTDVIIEGNEIKNLAKTTEDTDYGPEAEIIDCSNCVVIPGLINTHHHFYQILTRNLPAVQNSELFDWLVYLYEIWKNIKADDIYWSSMSAIAELLKTGCTCTTDHHYLYPGDFNGDIMAIQFEAAEKLGIRFSPTRGSMSRSRKDGGLPPDCVVQTGEEILRDSERVINLYHDPSPFSMRKIILAPCSPFSVSPELMRDTAALARKHGVLLHTHLAETFDENDFCIEKHGIRPLQLMMDCGFIGPDVSYAHGIHFNTSELEILRDAGASICHCPSSNMRLGSGIARIREMLDLGINVGLAVDGSASNDSSDMLGEVRNALLLQRVNRGASAMTVEEAFSIASSGGASTLNFPECGFIKPGYAADIAVFDLSGLDHAGSLTDPLASLLFCGYSHTALHTIVNGRFAVKDGRLCGESESVIASSANRQAEMLFAGSAG